MQRNKALMFSDLHLHIFKQNYGSKVNRLDEGIKLIHRTFDLANEEGINTIYFVGDLTHSKHNLQHKVIQALVNAFTFNFDKYPNVTVEAIAGNHDSNAYGEGSSNTIKILSNLFPNRFIDLESNPKRLANLDIVGISYRKTQNDFDKVFNELVNPFQNTLLFTHQTNKRSGFDSYEIDEDDHRFLNCFIVNGHIHKREQVTRSFYNLGSTCQTNAGEASYLCGWSIIDLDTFDIEFIPNTRSPTFIYGERPENDDFNFYIQKDYGKDVVLPSLDVDLSVLDDVTAVFDSYLTTLPEDTPKVVKTVGNALFKQSFEGIDPMVKGVDIESVDLQGYKTYLEPTHLKLNTKGLTYITGLNGSGKTTLIDCLCWCFFGKDLKGKTQVEPIDKPKKFKGCLVMVAFILHGVRYSVIRKKNFKEIEKTGKVTALEVWNVDTNTNLTKDKDLKEATEFLSRLTGYSFESFTTLVNLNGSGFTTLTPLYRRRFLKDAFRLYFLDNFKDLARGKVQELEEKVKNVTLHNLDLIEEKVNAFTLDEVKIKTEYDKHVIKLENEQVMLNEYRRILTKVQTELKNANYGLAVSSLQKLGVNNLEQEKKVVQDAKDNAKVQTRLQELDTEILTLTVNIEHRLKRIENLPTLNGVCSTCGQDMPDVRSIELKKQETNEKKIKLLDSIKQLKNRRNKLQKEQITLKQSKGGLENVYRTHLTYLLRLRSLDKNLNYVYEFAATNDKLSKHIKNILTPRIGKQEYKVEHEKTWVNNYLELYTKAKLEAKERKRYLELKEENEKNQKEISKIKEALDVYTFWLKDVTGTGFTSYITNTYIKVINEALKRYISVFGADVRLEVDTEKKTQPINIVTSYGGKWFHNLSMGETQSVNAVIGLALNDLLRHVSGCNLVFADELFTKLDEVNSEAVPYLLEHIAREGKSVYLITHKKDYNTNFTRNLEVVKVGNTSYIKK